jgi:Flp pilus assembly protein TadG
VRDRRLTRRDERGAVLILTAAFSLVAVLMLAAVIDLGDQRQELKQVTLSTDAAALAAASAIDFRDPNAKGTDVHCATVRSTDAQHASVGALASSYWTRNGGSGPLDCKIFFDSVQANTAYVTVTATNFVDYAFEGVTGQAGGSVTGQSSARIAQATGGLLYPVGLCTDSKLASYGTPPLTIEPPAADGLVFDASCGGSGNKRQIQFITGLRGDSCGKEGMWCWDFNHGGFDGKGAIPQIVESDTGKDWQKAESIITSLATNKTKIWIPAVRSRPDLPSTGTIAQYEITHFVEVQITSYSKRRGLGFLVHRVVPFSPGGPGVTSDVYTARVHLCGTGQGVGGCDVKTAPPPKYVAPDPHIDLRDLCKATGIAYAPGQTVRVGADDRLTEPVTVSYTVENPANCDPPVTLRAVSPLRTVSAAPGTRVGNTYPFTFPAGTLMGPDATDFVLEFSEDGFLTDATGSLSTLGPCRIRTIALVPSKTRYSASGNELKEDLTVRVGISRPETCGGLTVRTVERKSNGVVNDVWIGSPTSTSFDALIRSGTRRYPNETTWDIEVWQGPVKLNVPAVSFTT